MTQQSHKDQLFLDQVEVSNISCKNGRKLSLNILLEEVFATNTVNEIIIIDDIIDKVPKY